VEISIIDTSQKNSRQEMSQSNQEHSIGFALVGCGQIAQKYASLLKDHLAEAKLVAVCDIAPEKAQTLGEKYAIPWFSNTHQMMTQLGDKIDVISVLTPSGYHCKNVLELARYGKHLCVEKPMALTLKDADAMIEACKQAGIYLFVVKQNRLNLPIQKLKQALNQGRLGKLVLGSICLRWCRPQSYYDNDKWRGSMALDGGVFANQASHFIDLLQWLMGNVESVVAKGATRLVNIEAEDTGIALLKFSNGALGVVEATTAARPSNLEGSLTILGEKGTVEIGGIGVNEMRVWKFTEPQEEDEVIFGKLKEEQHINNLGHLNYLKTVIQTLKYGAPPFLDGKEGRRSLELLVAIYESIETGKEVYLGTDVYHSRLGR
jgi:predicted dehydrogenase